MQDDEVAIWDALAHHDAVLTLERIERVTVHRTGTTPPAAPASSPVAFEEMPRAFPASTSSSSLFATGLRWLMVSLFVLGALGFFVMSSGSTHGTRRIEQVSRSIRTDAVQPPPVRPAAAAPGATRGRVRPQRNATTPPPVSNRPATVETPPSSAEPASYVTPAGREVIRAPGGYLNAADSPLLR
jgi:hypothetical protein